ncbi:cupin domain-containing protein [Edaphobacter aggregans]|uniref:cupin domain-containing protein n=1 Tax=Edaphobacter aggregans TaxID=570835 RepID=UPI0006904AEA|nr:cupin domain-containing protein [Edaphobacter aggregans]
MKTQCKFRQWPILSAMLVCSSLANQWSFAQESGQRLTRTAFSHPLPALIGNKLPVEGVEVTYGPGAASPAHSHSCPVIGYVLSGAIRTQVKDQPEVIYKAGESFYEAPNGVHLVSANASDKEPAKLLAFFVCDHNAELSTPVKGGQK